MGKTNAFAANFLKLVFENSAIAGIGDAPGLQPSGSPGSLYVSLHTSDPGVAGNQTTNEANYTGYGRVAVARSGGAWSLTSQTISNIAAITFPQCVGGTNTITHFGVGTDPTGAGNLLWSAALNASIAVSNLITPQFNPAQLTDTEA